MSRTGVYEIENEVVVVEAYNVDVERTARRAAI
jgi:hypothetical protein